MADLQVAVIVNPVKVADADALRTEVTRRSGGRPPLWLETTVEDPGAGQAAAAIAAEVDVVLVSGGDGTVAVCAGALAGTGIAMGIVPAGTGNLLARNLAIPLDVGAALDVAFGPDRRKIDVLDAGEHRFVVMAGLGFDAALIRDTDEKLKARVGWLAYLGGLARALHRTPRVWFTVEVDDETPLRERAVGVLVANVGQLQGGVALLPDATPDDGLLDVILLLPRSLRDWPVLAWRILRRKPHGRHTDIRRGSRVRVSAERDVPVEYDGDLAGETAELSVTVLPAALVVCGAAQ